MRYLILKEAHLLLSASTLSSLHQTEKIGAQKPGGNLCYSIWSQGSPTWQMLQNEALSRKTYSSSVSIMIIYSTIILPSIKGA